MPSTLGGEPGPRKPTPDALEAGDVRGPTAVRALLHHQPGSRHGDPRLSPTCTIDFGPHQRSKRPSPPMKYHLTGESTRSPDQGRRAVRSPWALNLGTDTPAMRPGNLTFPAPISPGGTSATHAWTAPISPSREQGRSPGGRSPPPLRVGGSSATDRDLGPSWGAARVRLPAGALQQAPGTGGQAVDRRIRDQWYLAHRVASRDHSTPRSRLSSARRARTRSASATRRANSIHARLVEAHPPRGLLGEVHGWRLLPAPPRPAVPKVPLAASPRIRRRPEASDRRAATCGPPPRASPGRRAVRSPR